MSNDPQNRTDDDSFFRRIGWQAAPPGEPLPDDYEERLLERIFAEGSTLGEGTLEIAPTSGAISLRVIGPIGRDATHRSATHRSATHRSATHRSAIDRSAIDRSAIDRSAIDRSAIDRSAIDRSAIDRNGARMDVCEATEARKPLVEPLAKTPPVSPRLPWRSRPVALGLAAAATIALVGLTTGPGSPAPVTPVAAPAPTDDVMRELRARRDAAPPPSEAPPSQDGAEDPAPEVRPDELLSCDDADPDEACRRDGAEAPPDDSSPVEPDPGARKRRLLAQVVARPRGASPAAVEGPTAHQPDAFASYDLERIAAGMPPAFDPDADEHAVAVTSVGATSAHGHVTVDLPTIAAVQPAAWLDHPSHAAAKTAPGRTHNAMASLATPEWLGLDVSLPRDVVAEIPTGLRVMGSIDLSKTHRQLRF